MNNSSRYNKWLSLYKPKHNAISDTDFVVKLRQAEKETNTNPSQAQKDKGTYSKGRFQHDEITFIIENPVGSIRTGVDSDGTPWVQEMKNSYGYFKEAKGVDKDKLDFFIGPKPVSGNIYIVAQNKQDGSFDEHKVMYGFLTEEQAKAAYLSNYSRNWKGFRKIVKIDKEFFKNSFMKHSSDLNWLTNHNYI